MPTQFILTSEQELVKRADITIASSRGVKEHIEQISTRPVQLWENVADTRLYSEIKSDTRRARAVFAGNLTPSKVDFELVYQLAETGTEVILAGPTAIDGTHAIAETNRLKKHPHIAFTGNLSPTELAHLLNSCTVGLIPYHVNEYTAGVFPMKVYEYLAAGLAVVSTQLPSLAELTDVDIHITSRDTFVTTVQSSLPTNNHAVNQRKTRAESHSWEARTAAAINVIDGVTPN